jgi:hypothetical protein
MLTFKGVKEDQYVYSIVSRSEENHMRLERVVDPYFAITSSPSNNLTKF